MSDRYAHATSRLDRSSSFLDRLAEAALAVLASASALYTYQGATTLLTEEADTWWLRSVAAVFAVAVGIGLFAAWSYVLRAAPHLIGFRGRFLAVLLTLLTATTALVTSSWLNAAALAGASARGAHLVETLEAFERLANAANAQRQRVQQVVPDLRVYQDRYERLAAAELNSGIITGAAGEGTMVATLTNVSQLFTSLVSEVEAYTQRSDVAVANIQAALAAARDSFRSGSPLDSREQLFAEQMTVIQENVIAIQEGSIVVSLRRQVERIERDLVAPVATGATAALRERQASGQRDVEVQLASIAAGLADAIHEISKENLEVPTFRILSTTEAVVRYWRQHIPAWAAAIGIDMLPLVLLIAVVAIAEQQRDVAMRAPAPRPSPRDFDRFATPPSPSPTVGLAEWGAPLDDPAWTVGNRVEPAPIRPSPQQPRASQPRASQPRAPQPSVPQPSAVGHPVHMRRNRP